MGGKCDSGARKIPGAAPLLDGLGVRGYAARMNGRSLARTALRILRLELALLDLQVPSPGIHDELRRQGTAPDDREPQNLQGFQVLVVDDEADARAILRVALESHGAAITETDRVSSALALLTAEPPLRRFDVLVSDIAMPERDGFGLMMALRAWEQPRTLRLPAVAVSGHGTREDRRRALESGFDRHLSKPVDVELLIDVIRELAFHSRRTH